MNVTGGIATKQIWRLIKSYPNAQNAVSGFLLSKNESHHLHSLTYFSNIEEKSGEGILYHGGFFTPCEE